MLRFGPSAKPGTKALSPNRSTVISVLDVGTSKVCCVIARLHPKPEGIEFAGRTHVIEVIGFGHQRSRGIKAGVVVDLDEAEQAIRVAVDAAERRAGMTVESLIVNVSGGRLLSDAFSASVSLAGQEVEENDIRRVLDAGRNHSAKDEAAVIHSLPIGYAIDGNSGIKDPRGMIGQRLAVDMHVVTANDASLRNLEVAINRCHLAVESFVVSPFASGLACLAGDEAELGVTCIDLGGGSTTASVFMEGKFVHCDGIALGGQHVTMDLARGLSTSLRHAELIKVKHGSVLPDTVSDFDSVPVNQIGDESGVGADVPPSVLARIIRPRVEETLELVRDRLNASGFAALVGRRVVLTGGGSQLTGMADLARSILGKNVRLGRPLGVTGLPAEARSAAFSAVVGLMIYPQTSDSRDDIGWSPSRSRSRNNAGRAMTGTGGYFGRMGRWIAENF
ncbi:MAG: cell division protein FtsA [Rhizobiales bacterium]|nr:cell division protein FtsA [Hyphomicrobiales bacterium]